MGSVSYPAPSFPFPRFLPWLVGLSVAVVSSLRASPEPNVELLPGARGVLERYCFDCHGNGIAKGGVTLDGSSERDARTDPELWARVLRNVRAGIMPPTDEARPEPTERAVLETWIKSSVFGLDPREPDPGHVTLRRLNRTEYRNTIRDLMGVDFDTTEAFPPDDSGHGFDHLGEVLTVSPLLLEKYLDAAQTIVGRAIPLESRAPAERVLSGRQLALGSLASGSSAPSADGDSTAPRVVGDAVDLAYAAPARLVGAFAIEESGRHELILRLRAVERYVDDVFDLNECQLTVRVDGELVVTQRFSREGDKAFEFRVQHEWLAGERQLEIELTPLTPQLPRPRNLRLRVGAVVVRGPLDPARWVRPERYERFFPRDPPAGRAERRAYATELLEDLASRAFRRPVDSATVLRLVNLAEATWQQSDSSFEAGVAQATVAILASPRFVFREEDVLPQDAGHRHPLVDEYALATRLSYFLWSTQPDERLRRLAREGRLRAELPAQVDRMLADERSQALIRNFVGQWLLSRDIGTVVVDEAAVFRREHPFSEEEHALRQAYRRLVAIPDASRTAEDEARILDAKRRLSVRDREDRGKIVRLPTSLREAMRDETEQGFAYLLREDRPLTELLDADYAFLNEDLARHYGIEGVEGSKMRRVTLPPDSPRGGVLTQGTFLVVSSNPSRTSPVKRGVFILESILGTPPAPPPPNIPPLENAVSPERLRTMTLRQNLAAHAENPVCASCHSRMDPLGLALENFNAVGRWRETEFRQSIDPAGRLITGESFANIRELKRVLATSRRDDFLRAVTEKMLTYALGRGLDHRDTETVDQLTARLRDAGARPSVLLRGVIDSAPFQRRRKEEAQAWAGLVSPPAIPPSP